ncbi:hypothetical protein AYO20_08532 [Fonsecaea nubica]|uniref:Uncharacterized protein n=1 Tax=Fonsecaea nubica TaxID=856822 RepID=A0A178CN82_9EURO|nr:hypothetical protein AYO20_08532 [Fonsecaea nubica]OAL30947.1 hypothetical protein AYO20_08532 [Fonsecaea nubica]
MFHGELFNDNGGFRGTPNSERDAAWDRITPEDPFPISASEVVKVGKSLESSIRYPEDKGGQYAANLEVFHQLHCLNLLRKATYFEYYADKEIMFKTTRHMIREHLDHCIDMLRISLQCTSDLTLITFNASTPEFPMAEYIPDFYTNHRCRNFEQTLDWYNDRRIPLHLTSTHDMSDERP